jgi:hypothetical protein
MRTVPILCVLFMATISLVLSYDIDTTLAPRPGPLYNAQGCRYCANGNLKSGHACEPLPPVDPLSDEEIRKVLIATAEASAELNRSVAEKKVEQDKLTADLIKTTKKEKHEMENALESLGKTTQKIFDALRKETEEQMNRLKKVYEREISKPTAPMPTRAMRMCQVCGNRCKHMYPVPERHVPEGRGFCDRDFWEGPWVFSADPLDGTYIIPKKLDVHAKPIKFTYISRGFEVPIDEIKDVRPFCV